MSEGGLLKVEYEGADEAEDEGTEGEEDGDGGKKRHRYGNIFFIHLTQLRTIPNTHPVAVAADCLH